MTSLQKSREDEDAGMDELTRISDDARAWLLRIRLDTPSDGERREFDAWRARDPRHGATYERLERIWDEAAELKELADLAPLEERPRTATWRRAVRPLAWAAAASMAAIVVFFAISGPSNHHATSVAEIREVRLPDGSEVTLGALSSIDVDFTDTGRRIALKSGEAFFSVEKDAARPFVVVVGDKHVRAVGTQFDVRRSEDAVRVSVLEGVVEVSQSSQPATGEPAPSRYPESASASSAAGSESLQDPERVRADRRTRIVTTGQQISAPIHGALEDVQPIEAAAPAAWRSGRLVYIDAPLREVVADANRYSRQRIELAEDSIGDLQISVTYGADQVDEMLSGLARTLPIEVTRASPDRIVLQARLEGQARAESR